MSVGREAAGYFRAQFHIGQRVNLDNDAGLVGTVTAVCFYSRGVEYQICWVANGDNKQVWIDEMRLSEAVT